MGYIQFGRDGLLRGYNEDEEHIFTWHYSDFEDLINETITPSMYHYMANYVADNFTKDDLLDLEVRNYYTGDLEAKAVDAYFAEPLTERIIMHEQMLTNLRAAVRHAEDAHSAAIDAMLEENKPFDHTSPIDKEYCNFMRKIIERERKRIENIERQICEEQEWRGGHEEGAEDSTRPVYDSMDE